MSKSAGAATEQGWRDMGEGIEPLNVGGGGFLTVQSLVDQGIDPMAFRYFTLTAKYRAQLNYTDDAIQGAQTALNGLYDFVMRAMERGPAKEKDAEWQQPYKERFLAAITDDLNVPAAVAAMHELISEANRRDDPAAILPTLFDWDRVFGLRLRETAEARLSETLPAEIQALIDDRQAARKERDFARADALRAQLRELGYEIEDTPQGVRWKRVA
jgi:cysteinyl-tRNA synthetase